MIISLSKNTLTLIAAYLDLKSLAAFMRVCKLWNRAADKNHPMWKSEIKGIKIGKLATVWEVTKYIKIAHSVLIHNKDINVNCITKLCISIPSFHIQHLSKFSNLKILKVSNGTYCLNTDIFRNLLKLKKLTISVQSITLSIILPISIEYLDIDIIEGDFRLSTLININECINLKNLIISNIYIARFYKGNNMKLESLTVNSFRTANRRFEQIIKNLSDFKTLKYIFINHIESFDIKYLFDLPKIEEVTINNSTVIDIEYIGFLNLELLSLSDLHLDSYEFLKNTRIKTIIIWDDDILIER